MMTLFQRMTIGSCLGLALLLAGLRAPSAHAGTIPITSNSGASESGLGTFDASLMYTAADASNATLVVSLTNTSPAANGGYITAFAFNNPLDLITGVTLASTSGTFDDLLGGPSFDDSVNGAPFGDFDIGATTAGNFQGGGPPANGIGVGDTETFTFSLTGSSLDTLSALSFKNALSENVPPDKNPQFFLARFRGFDDGGSDKVPAVLVPEPSSIALAGLGGLGAVGLLLRGRRRR